MWGEVLHVSLDALLAGNCARRRTYFLLLCQKKVGKEKAAPLAVAPSLRCGAACDARSWGGAAELTLRLRRAVRTTAASQITKHGFAAQAMPAPRPALLGTARGEGRNAPRAIAALGPINQEYEAERSDGPYGLRHPSGCAEERSGRGERMHRRMHSYRGLTHRICLNRALQARSELCGVPRTRAPQVARSEAKGRRQWGALLLPTFLVRARKVGRPPGRNPGQQRDEERGRQ